VRIDFCPCRADGSQFPRRAWLRSIRHVLIEASPEDFGYVSGRGAPALHQALVAYLNRVRGTSARPENIVICNGYAQGVGLIISALVKAGAKRLAVEDPSADDDAVPTARAAGLEVVGVPVGEDGIRVEALERTDADALILTPSHQWPTGAVLAPEARAAALRWAQRRGALIVEDDYDAEYRYDRAPIGALQGLARDQVVYGGSVSKTLSPMLRIGWLAAPAWLAEDLRRQKLYDDFATGMLDQLALAAFIAEGDLARHLRRVRPEYRRRRDAALRALAVHLPDARPAGVAAGLHVFVRLPPGTDERALRHAVARDGVRIERAARHWARPEDAPPAFVLGYGAIDEAAIERVVATIARAYRSLGATGSPIALGL
jgi:GntR family transcriptional regulator / MocR family aminotransferase